MAEVIVTVRQRPVASGTWSWFSYEYRRHDWHCEWRYSQHGKLLQYQEEDLDPPPRWPTFDDDEPF